MLRVVPRDEVDCNPWYFHILAQINLRAPWRSFPAAVGTPLGEHTEVPRRVGWEKVALYNQSDTVPGERG